MAVNRQKIWQINFNKYNAVGGGLKCCHPLNYKNTTVNQSPPHVGERGNPKLIPYETIVRATSGEPEAVEEVLRHYSRRIRLAALENGHVNTDTEDSIKQRLITALFQFRFD